MFRPISSSLFAMCCRPKALSPTRVTALNSPNMPAKKSVKRHENPFPPSYSCPTSDNLSRRENILNENSYDSDDYDDSDDSDDEFLSQHREQSSAGLIKTQSSFFKHRHVDLDYVVSYPRRGLLVIHENKQHSAALLKEYYISRKVREIVMLISDLKNGSVVSNHHFHNRNSHVSVEERIRSASEIHINFRIAYALPESRRAELMINLKKAIRQADSMREILSDNYTLKVHWGDRKGWSAIDKIMASGKYTWSEIRDKPTAPENCPGASMTDLQTFLQMELKHEYCDFRSSHHEPYSFNSLVGMLDSSSGRYAELDIRKRFIHCQVSTWSDLRESFYNERSYKDIVLLLYANSQPGANNKLDLASPKKALAMTQRWGAMGRAIHIALPSPVLLEEFSSFCP